jgi:transcriptional regulator with XRE-family HTH domain
MDVMSRESRQMSWRGQPKRVSVIAEMALRREKIAQRLGELRESNTLTQEQAAAKVGVTLRQWQRWEAGESVPYPRNMDVVASKFGISVAEFFDDEPLSGSRTTLLEARVEELEAAITELRAGLATLAADSLSRTRAQRAPAGKGRSRRPAADSD